MHDPRNDELLREGLRRLPEVRAGEGFTRRVLARIEAEERSAEAGRRGPGRSALPAPAPTLRWAVAAAAVLALGVTAVLLLSPLGGPPPATGPATAADAGGAAAAPPTGARPDAAGSPSGAATPDPVAVERLAAVDLAPPEVPLRDGEPAGDDPGAGASPTEAAGEADGGSGEGGSDGAAPRRSGSGAGEGGAANGRDRPAPSPALADPDAARRRLAELRQRQRALRAELAALSDFAQGDRAPALLLGGDESVELVVGLDPRRTADAGAIRPAVQRPAAGGSGPRHF